MSVIEMESKARELRELKMMKEELDAEITALEDILKSAMGTRETLICGEYKLTYQTVQSSRFDASAFRKAEPALAAAFTKPTSYRRFSVK
jgi:predicted phage-related endonuclease